MQGFSATARLRTAGRWVWRTVRGVSAVAGMVAAGMTLGQTALWCAVVALWLMGVVIMSLARSAGLRTIGVRWVLVFGLLSTSWLGLVLFFGSTGVVWVLVLGLTTAPVRRLWMLRRLRTTPAPPGPTPLPTGLDGPLVDVVPAETDLSTLSPDVSRLATDELCLAWRRSYVHLVRTGLTPAMTAIVHRRQSILDELDRRDPDGLGLWLASNPRAAGNPWPYLGSALETDGETTRPRRQDARGDEQLGDDAA